MLNECMHILELLSARKLNLMVKQVRHFLIHVDVKGNHLNIWIYSTAT